MAAFVFAFRRLSGWLAFPAYHHAPLNDLVNVGAWQLTAQASGLIAARADRYLLGVLLASLAFLFGLSILWETMIDGKSVPGYPSLVVGLMTIGGVQLIMIGIVGEYIGKILSEIKARPVYFVAEHTVKTAADTGAANDPQKRSAAE